MTGFLHDLRHAVRSLGRSPGFALAAILSLALGIGGNAAIFSVVRGVLLRPAPFADIDRLAMVWETDRASNTTREPSSIPDFADFRTRSQSFTHLAAITAAEISVSVANADPERVAGLSVTANYLETTGLQVLAGRGFTREEGEPGGPRAVLISEALWDRLYQRSDAAVGATIRLNDVDWPIVGVMPDGADFGVLQVLGAADYGRGFADRGGRTRVDLWAPLRLDPQASRDNHPIIALGRLAPSASHESAQAELTAITADLERTYPQQNANRGAFIEPMDDVVFGGVRTAMFVLVAAVGMVLLVACANVANLLLARAVAREHEVSVRTALGASTGRIARQFLAEGVVLAGTGAAFGLMLAYALTGVLTRLVPGTIPRADEIRLDPVVLAVTGGVAVAVAIILGLLPTLHARRVNLQESIQSSGGRAAGRRWARTFRSALVVGELATATTLMVGSGLLIRSLWTLQSVDPGFDSARVIKAEFQLPQTRYPQDFSVFPNWPERQRFQTELLARLAAAPGVESAALATANPMDAGFTSSIRVVGREAEAGGWPEPSIRTISDGYLATMQVPLRAGRAFESTDGASSAPVVLINEAARDRYFDGRDPLGTQVNLWGQDRTVVGVVGNERFKGLAAAAPPAVYLPLTQAPTPSAVLVRMRGDAGGATAGAAVVRQAVREVDPLLAVFGVEPLDETIRGTLAQRRFTMLVLITFAGAALVLAVIGVHGVLSYAVAQRTREIGIRVALGADLGRIQGLVLRDGIGLTLAGIGVGIAGALAVARVMRALLFGVQAYDPLTFIAVGATLAAVALAACWFPARRAARLDPIIALRAE